ncbi:MAG TPA: phosphoenolpyruvate--protein phosphotransferase [Gemmataceae bacterium]
MKGVPVSPGVAVARAYRVDEVLARHHPTVLDAAALSGEATRFENATTAAAAELDGIIDRVSKQVGEQEASIFRAHRSLLRDPALIGKVTARILHDHMDAGSALQATLDEYAALFDKIPDDYIRERLSDVRDVVGRVMAHLTLQHTPDFLKPDEPVILAAPEILPSQAVMFERLPVAGIMTETGGTTGHAAILARSLGIPAVSGLDHLLREVQTGDLVVLDGREGVVHVNPGPEVESAYRKLQREYVHLRDRMVENRDLAAVCRDGTTVDLLANVNGPSDAVAAGQVGAVGVGLYRTEYLFLTHQAVPTEEEQLATYRAVIEASPGRAVTVRTLDLGGDKQVPYLGNHREANPFMGWRSIRLSTEYPEFFQTQLRAILRAGAHGRIRVMFPMVSTLEEVQRLKRWVKRTEDALRRDGLQFAENVPLGVMIEVPSAALCIGDILDEVDFASIGSNDLLQYVMAADRDNPKVAHLCDPFSPAIYRLLNQVISACNARDKPVTLCGEMAGRPRCVLTLFGMGLREYSMSPGFVPTIKELVRAIDCTTARDIARRVLKMRTVGEIKGFLTHRLQQLCPNVAVFDTFQ